MGSSTSAHHLENWAGGGRRWSAQRDQRPEKSQGAMARFYCCRRNTGAVLTETAEHLLSHAVLQKKLVTKRQD